MGALADVVFGGTTRGSSINEPFTDVFLFSIFQDADEERPLKRHGSSLCVPSPPSESSSSDDELQRTVIPRAQTTSNGEGSSSTAANQRDSQTVYSSSVKSSVNSRNKKFEAVPSPVGSSNDASEASDFDVIPDAVEYVDSPFDFAGVFSPMEAPKSSDEEAGFFIKGDKTPHSLKKRASKYSYK